LRLCINPHCGDSEWVNCDTAHICSNCGGELSIHHDYQVRSRLTSRSGFSAVYVIEDANHRQKVLKVLQSRFNQEPRMVALFQQEAQLLQMLPIPGLPQVDAYVHHPLPNGDFLHGIIMEKIPGQTLYEWLQGRDHQPIDQAQAIAWLREIVEILQLIHQQQYFHRDIKPCNIMVKPTGELVLIDFGSARQESCTYIDKLYGDGGITQIASVGYTPPEQERGFAVAQSDFYALGMTMIHLVTGKYPMDMYDPSLGMCHWQGFAPHLTPGLVALLDGLTAIAPIDRPLNCASILHWLDHIEANPDLAAEPIPVWGCHKNQWLSAIAAVSTSLVYLLASSHCLLPSFLPFLGPPANSCPSNATNKANNFSTFSKTL
jgi:serine/threonine protein kinase